MNTGIEHGSTNHWPTLVAHPVGKSDLRKGEKQMASLASVFPILPGKTEQWKRFCQEMVGPRRSEYEATKNRLGITRDFASLQQTPQGDVTVVYLEAQDLPRVFEGYASSQEPFDVWYREQLKDI